MLKRISDFTAATTPLAGTELLELETVGGDARKVTAQAIANLAPASGMTNPMTTSGDIIYGGASGTPTRLAAGTNGHVLTLASGVPAWAAASGGGGGLTNFTDGLNTASPNATVPVSSLTATNAATDVDAALVPKGGGALVATVPTGVTAGGNKRGTNAVDWQISRSATAQVASGSNSVIGGGSSNTASGGNSFVGGGSTNTASGNHALVIAGANNTASGSFAIAAGDQANATGQYAIALGNAANASGTRAVAIGGGTADAQDAWALGKGATANAVIGAYSEGAQNAPTRSRYTLHAFTSDATPKVLTTNGSTAATNNQVTTGTFNNRSGIYRGIVVARKSGTGGGTKSWEFIAHLNRSGGTMALAAAVTPTVVASSGVAWSIAVTADNTNNCLQVEVTGEAATNIAWACFVDGQEVEG
jgi:hypothetical protein